MPSSSPTAPNRCDASTTKFSTIYNAVMTPIIFVSFLASLAWVDFRYTLLRSHRQSQAPPTLMPAWLHQILYREAPYQYVKVKADSPATSAAREDGAKWYYHTKQRKLMKMEVDDAFQIRGVVLVVMGLLALLATWTAWRLVLWISMNVAARLS